MKIGLLSLGCPKNLVDSEVMLGLAQRAGHELTHDAAEADVLVVNTCAFIDAAKQESIDAILEMARQKDDGRCRRLVVTGCLAERYREELRAEIPEIDAVLGTGEVPRIVEAIEGAAAPAGGAAPVTLYRRGPSVVGSGPATAYVSARPAPARRRAAVDTAPRPLPTYLYDADTPRTLTTPRHFAYVKVAEGCDYTCSFCIIPRLRGQYRSRPAASIVAEARALAARGVRELLLVSQDTTFYGIDRGERGALARLLGQLDAVDDLARVRLLYLYPTTVTRDVLDTIAGSSRVCRYVDLPLQHSARSVLARMRRPGGRATYERLLQRIRDRIPGVTLRTTFIVGFPGETDAEFEDLCAFVEDVGFDHVGVFTYSHEEGTSAHALRDDVPRREKERRRRQLMTIQRRVVTRRHRALKGRVLDVMVDGPSPEHDWVLQGRLDGQAPEIDPVVYLTDCDPAAHVAGQVVPARIVGARGYDLVAAPTGDRRVPARGRPEAASRQPSVTGRR
jgi:ribosomal protein S12 methylthiotransferase